MEEFRTRIKQFTGALWTPQIEEAILANFEILPDQTIRPHLSYERHMQVLRALWEQRPPQLYDRVQCPVLLLPCASPPRDEAEQRFIARKRANVELAARSLAQSETVWFEDTIHDVPLQRPERLAEVIVQCTRKYHVTR